MIIDPNNKQALGDAIQEMIKIPKKIFTDGETFDRETGKLRCACGKKLLDASETRITITPYIRGYDRLCTDCIPLVKGMCGVMCMGCREIISYIAPGKDEDGFVREPNKIYHVKDCPQCNSERFKNKSAFSILAEKAVFLNKTKGIPFSKWL